MATTTWSPSITATIDHSKADRHPFLQFIVSGNIPAALAAGSAAVSISNITVDRTEVQIDPGGALSEAWLTSGQALIVGRGATEVKVPGPGTGATYSFGAYTWNIPQSVSDAIDDLRSGSGSWSIKLSDKSTSVRGSTSPFAAAIASRNAEGRLKPQYGDTSKLAATLALEDAHGRLGARNLQGDVSGLAATLAGRDASGRMTAASLQGGASPLALGLALSDASGSVQLHGDASALELTAALRDAAGTVSKPSPLPPITTRERSFIIGQQFRIALPVPARATRPVRYGPVSETPEWVGFDAAGIVGIAPNSPVVVDVPFRLTDAAGRTVDSTQRISVTAEDTTPAFPPIRNRTFVVGDDVDEYLPLAAGGNGTLTYGVTGTIDGITIDGRHLSGTLTRARLYKLTYWVEDEDGDRYDQDFFVTVAPVSTDSPLVLPHVGDLIFFKGDGVDETLPAPYGGTAPYTYTITPAIPVTDSDTLEDTGDLEAIGIRRVRGMFERAGKSTHVIKVEDADGIVRDEDITIDVRDLDIRPAAPVVQGERFVDARIALHIPPVGSEGQPNFRRGFSYWTDDTKLTLDGVTYEPGEVLGLQRYQIEMASTDPLPVVLEGGDPVFRQWLQFGGSARDAEVRFLLRIGSGDWETAFTIVGRVGRVVESGVNFVMDVDSEVYIPSQQGVSRWSDEEQQEAFPGDRFWSQLKALARGHTLTWPG